MRSAIDGLLGRRVEHVEAQIDFNTHVIIFYPIHLVGGDQVDERERQHRDGGKDHQTFEQTPPENATLRAISSHEAVVCARARFTRMPFSESTAPSHHPFERWKFNLALAFCSRLVPAEVIQSDERFSATNAITALAGKLFWSRSCTQSTNSTIIDDSDGRLVFFYKQMQIIR